MVGQPFDLVRSCLPAEGPSPQKPPRSADPSERFQGRNNAGMEHPPPLLEQTTVSHLMGQRVLEGVGTFGEQVSSHRGLGRLEMRQAAVQPPRTLRR